MKNTKKMALAGVLIAVGVVCSPLNIPLGIVKCFPVQHAINIIGGIILGPSYAVLMAFCISLIRLMIGAGTLLAFSGSMVGALLCGVLYKYRKKLYVAFIGELLGTGLLGALLSYPIAVMILGREAALFAFVIPFSASSLIGAIMGIVIVYTLDRLKLLKEVTTNV